jgi:hypothetical protein
MVATFSSSRKGDENVLPIAISDGIDLDGPRPNPAENPGRSAGPRPNEPPVGAEDGADWHADCVESTSNEQPSGPSTHPTYEPLVIPG